MGYQPDLIQRYLGDGSHLGVKLTYSIEESPLGTAGAIKNAEAFLDETFVVFNGDIITDINLTEMLQRHREVKPKASIALTPVENPTIYGVVETDEKGMVLRFLEKPGWQEVTTNMINAGIYVLEPDVLEHIPSSTHSMFERNTFPRLLEMGEPILGYPSDAYWIDIGSPEKYLKAHHDLLLKWGSRDVSTEGEVRVDPTARLEGPLLIAGGCSVGAGSLVRGPSVLGPGCDIGRGAVIEGSVLWSGTKVSDKAVLRNCVVGSGSCVQEGCKVLDNSVLGDDVTVARDIKLPRGARVWADGRIDTA